MVQASQSLPALNGDRFVDRIAQASVFMRSLLRIEFRTASLPCGVPESRCQSASQAPARAARAQQNELRAIPPSFATLFGGLNRSRKDQV